MIKIRVLLAVIAAPVTTAALVLVAQGAQASTPACTTGAYVSYCGTQADNGSPGLRAPDMAVCLPSVTGNLTWNFLPVPAVFPGFLAGFHDIIYGVP
jgi:hypothetical protein